MSYDLYFWKQSEECDVPPDTVIHRFSNSQVVDGILPLDTNTIIQRLKDAFPAISENPIQLPECDTQLLWEHHSDGCFIAIPCTKYLYIESHGATSNVLNRLIDLALEFECPLYDPQTNERYAG